MERELNRPSSMAPLCPSNDSSDPVRGSADGTKKTGDSVRFTIDHRNSISVITNGESPSQEGGVIRATSLKTRAGPASKKQMSESGSTRSESRKVQMVQKLKDCRVVLEDIQPILKGGSKVVCTSSNGCGSSNGRKASNPAWSSQDVDSDSESEFQRVRPPRNRPPILHSDDDDGDGAASELSSRVQSVVISDSSNETNGLGMRLIVPKKEKSDAHPQPVPNAQVDSAPSTARRSLTEEEMCDIIFNDDIDIVKTEPDDGSVPYEPNWMDLEAASSDDSEGNVANPPTPASKLAPTISKSGSKSANFIVQKFIPSVPSSSPSRSKFSREHAKEGSTTSKDPIQGLKDADTDSGSNSESAPKMDAQPQSSSPSLSPPPLLYDNEENNFSYSSDDDVIIDEPFVPVRVKTEPTAAVSDADSDSMIKTGEIDLWLGQLSQSMTSSPRKKKVMRRDRPQFVHEIEGNDAEEEVESEPEAGPSRSSFSVQHSVPDKSRSTAMVIDSDSVSNLGSESESESESESDSKSSSDPNTDGPMCEDNVREETSTGQCNKDQTTEDFLSAKVARVIQSIKMKSDTRKLSVIEPQRLPPGKHCNSRFSLATASAEQPVAGPSHKPRQTQLIEARTRKRRGKNPPKRTLHDEMKKKGGMEGYAASCRTLESGKASAEVAKEGTAGQKPPHVASAAEPNKMPTKVTYFPFQHAMFGSYAKNQRVLEERKEN